MGLWGCVIAESECKLTCDLLERASVRYFSLFTQGTTASAFLALRERERVRVRERERESESESERERVRESERERERE